MNQDDKNELKRRARAFLRGKGAYVYAGRGRTDRVGKASNSVRVEIMEGSGEPKLAGLPYWKTTIRNGSNFSRTLYTPSTLRVIVGKDWNPYNIDL